MGLTEEAKAQLRAEEIYREEIRRELRGKLSKLNQPFVIWVLSTVVVGLISFAYSQYSERTAITQLNHQKATDISLEIRFRTRQVDELLSEALEASDDVRQLSDEELRDIISSGRLSDNGKKVQTLFRAAPQLKVVAELGGIGSVPRTDQDAIVWIGGTGWGSSALPRGRGFRSEEFKNLSLQDLWEDYRIVTSSRKQMAEELSEVKAIFARFDNATEPSATVSTLPRIGSNALTMREWSESSDMEAVKTTTANVGQWIDEVHSAWESLKNLLFDNDVAK